MVIAGVRIQNIVPMGVPRLRADAPEFLAVYHHSLPLQAIKNAAPATDQEALELVGAHGAHHLLQRV